MESNCDKSLDQLIRRLSNDPDEDKIIQTICYFRDGGADVAEIARLARVIAASGRTMSWDESILTADVASTGGPTSLSTLLSPLFLVAYGVYVPKLGVPGRPAGGIDCLAQIPGYRIQLSSDDIRTILSRCRYAHFLAVGETAPLDGRMFDIRKRTGALQVPSLVVASLLAKKLAVGVKCVALDIRVSNHGNFGADWNQATTNAKLFRDVAEELGIKAFPVLTDGRFPYQPYLGRAESLIALESVFSSKSERTLSRHTDLCRTLAVVLVEDKSSITTPDVSTLRKIFSENLEAQGADPDDFEQLVARAAGEHRHTIKAERSGFFDVPLQELRDLIVERQRANSTDEFPFPDPVGIKLFHSSGSWVHNGEPVASVRASDSEWTLCKSRLSKLLGLPIDKPYGPGIEGAIDD